MSVRDEEIKRLVFYAKSLGAKVIIRHYNNEEIASVTVEPSKYTIIINKKHHDNKTQIILSLLHELSHIKYTILNNYKFTDVQISDVLNNGRKISKKKRKEIADFEIKSLPLMTNIASELNVKIPMWKILKAVALDTWIYQYYYENGNDPSNKLIGQQSKKLTEKYKK